MSYVAHHKDFDSLVADQTQQQIEPVAKKSSILRRILDSLWNLARGTSIDRSLASLLVGWAEL
jgi:hypothetical protein